MTLRWNLYIRKTLNNSTKELNYVIDVQVIYSTFRIQQIFPVWHVIIDYFTSCSSRLLMFKPCYDSSFIISLFRLVSVITKVHHLAARH